MTVGHSSAEFKAPNDFQYDNLMNEIQQFARPRTEQPQRQETFQLLPKGFSDT